MLSFKWSTVGAFVASLRVLSWKLWQEGMCCFSILTSLGWKKVKPHPQNWILVPLKGSSQTFLWARPSFVYRSPPPGPDNLCVADKTENVMRNTLNWFILLRQEHYLNDNSEGFHKLLDALSTPPLFTVVRVNTLKTTVHEAWQQLQKILEEVCCRKTSEDVV